MTTTTDKSLQDRAIKIKGKDYVLVADRINYFNSQYPNGSIQTRIISELDAERVIVQATVIPDNDTPQRRFVDYSQAVWGQGMVNTAAALENACTSAVGRALAYMGIGVIDSVASADELNKASQQNYYTPVMPMIEKIKAALQEKGVTDPTDIKNAIHLMNNGRAKMTKDEGAMILAQIDGLTNEELQAYLLEGEL